MTDLLIVTRKNRTTVYPESFKGESWLKKNYIMDGVVYQCSSEHLNEFIDKARKEEIEYEER